MRAVLLIAFPDIADTFFAIYGLNHTGSGVFVMVFAFVTIWVAALRWFFLRLGLSTIQMLAIGLIVGGQAVVVLDERTSGGEGGDGNHSQFKNHTPHAGGGGAGGKDALFMFGMSAVLVASLADAIMYVFSEKALNTLTPAGAGAGIARVGTGGDSTGGGLLQDVQGWGESSSSDALLPVAAYEDEVAAAAAIVAHGADALNRLEPVALARQRGGGGEGREMGNEHRLVTEDEVCCLVGAINLGLTCCYVGGYSAAGKWGAWVSEPIHAKGGDPTTVAVVWMINSVLYFAHFASFYYVCRQSSVSAGVNKASQAAAIFFTSSALFCNDYSEQCLTVYKGIAAVLVCAGVLLYGVKLEQCIASTRAGT
jgi:hypothetical protein